MIIQVELYYEKDKIILKSLLDMKKTISIWVFELSLLVEVYTVFNLFYVWEISFQTRFCSLSFIDLVAINFCLHSPSVLYLPLITLIYGFSCGVFSISVGRPILPFCIDWETLSSLLMVYLITVILFPLR